MSGRINRANASHLSLARGEADGLFPFRRPQAHWSRYCFGAAVLLTATAVAFAAQDADMPRTAAVVYLLGVTFVGAIVGVWGGLLAAVLASLVYNFFLSDPIFRFSVTSIEEIVPLVAFNVSAVASGILAGRLRDRAAAAEQARQKMRALLEVSQRLQQALRADEISDAIGKFLGAGVKVAIELYVIRGRNVKAITKLYYYQGLARELLASGRQAIHLQGVRAHLIGVAENPLAVLILSWKDPRYDPTHNHDIEAFVSLLSLALERCMLLERLSEAELVRRSEEFKTALLSSVSHDMRTPLSAISASASSLARFGDGLSEETRGDLLQMIQEQCERLNRYTTNLLNLGRLQAGVDQRQFVSCDAIDAIGSAITQGRNLNSGHEFRKQFGVSNAIVKADPVMLEQTFFNVLENAIHYSPAAKPITVSTCLQDGNLHVTIEDEGPGIDPEEAGHVFERFYRSRSVSTHQGTGLGLSITKGFVEAFGGRIELRRARASGGTVVEISLPIIRSAGQSGA